MPDRLGLQGQNLPPKPARKALVIRSSILLIALLIGALMLRSHVARHVAKADPMRGAEMAPGNALILAGAARTLIQGPNVDARMARAFARDALADDPTHTQAIETLALAQEMLGNRSQAERLFLLSSRISRRSLATRVWLIERAVEKGDVAAALMQMDIALRTSEAAPPLIFPALKNGLADPSLLRPIARLVDRPGDWREAFLLDVATDGDPASGAALLLEMRDRNFITAKGFDRAIVGRLIDAGRFRLARNISNAIGSRKVTGRLVDGDFASDDAEFPFGWGLTKSGAIGAFRSQGSRRASLNYHANAGKSGQVAAQLLMLPPGRYRLSSNTVRIAHPSPFWNVACGNEGGKQLARIDAAAGSGASIVREFEVPENCDGQWLTLNLLPNLNGEQSGAIASLAITAVIR